MSTRGSARPPAPSVPVKRQIGRSQSHPSKVMSSAASVDVVRSKSNRQQPSSIPSRSASVVASSAVMITAACASDRLTSSPALPSVFSVVSDETEMSPSTVKTPPLTPMQSPRHQARNRYPPCWSASASCQSQRPRLHQQQARRCSLQDQSSDPSQYRQDPHPS